MRTVATGPGLGLAPVAPAGSAGVITGLGARPTHLRPRGPREVRLRGGRRLRLPHREGPASQQRWAEVRRAVRHGLLDQHHAGPGDGDRRLDGRADHHGDSAGPPSERRAAHPRAPLHRLQRDGRGGPAGPRGLPAERAAGEPAQQPKKISVPLFESVVPAGLARRLRASGDAAAQRADLGARPRRVPRACRRATAASATRRAESRTRRTTPDSWAGPRRARKAIPFPTSPRTRTRGSPGPRTRSRTTCGTGNKPDGDVAGGLMDEVIHGHGGRLQAPDEAGPARDRPVSEDHPRRA